MNKSLRKLIFANRQPTLWRHGLPAVTVVADEDDDSGVIRVSPLFLEPLNADHDGDTIALYCIHDNEALKEMHDNAYLKNNFFYDHSQTFLSVIRHEALYAAYLLSYNFNNIDFSRIIKINNISDLAESIELYNNPKICVEFNNKKYSYGIVLINKWCGFDDIYINFEISKKNNNLISQIIYDYSKTDFYDNLTNLEKSLFFYISISDNNPPTINIDEIIDVVDDESKRLISLIPNNIEIGYIINQSIIERCLFNLSKKNNTLYKLTKSGSRFNPKQLARSCINIGFNADAKNNIVPKAINTNLMVGLNEKEFFIGASGTRKGIVDKGRSTPDSGYLERSLVMGLSCLEIVEEDCGCNEYLETKIINEDHIKTLIGKYVFHDGQLVLFDDNIAKEYKPGDDISIRSTILCKTKNQKICKKCWGEKNVISKYIGILAGQILSERFTQLTMRSFHDSGSAQIKINDDLKKFIQLHLEDIKTKDETIELVFDTNEIPIEFGELNSFVNIKDNSCFFKNVAVPMSNEDPINALKNVKNILRAAKSHIKTPVEYYNLLMKEILTVGTPYSGFCELLLTNMFLIDYKNNLLWRYDTKNPIKYKIGDKTMASKVSPLLNLLYQQNQKTIANIDVLDSYINKNDLTIYEKIFLERF